MNIIWLCVSSLLLITAVISGQNIDTTNIRANQSVAGVFQVSSLNNLNEPQYAFNASEARRLCLSLGVNIASKAQVQEANRRGFETCRFGWIDEHFAVIPRIKALSNCGQSRTGLVPWRAPVTNKFDVFCFNESGITQKQTPPRQHSPQLPPPLFLLPPQLPMTWTLRQNRPTTLAVLKAQLEEKKLLSQL
ncbi:hypothetical protein INR49_024554 [Caranx melampygus]|nr:hypothetical protein INR49_024554 [Caranx melampygus]